MCELRSTTGTLSSGLGRTDRSDDVRRRPHENPPCGSVCATTKQQLRQVRQRQRERQNSATLHLTITGPLGPQSRGEARRTRGFSEAISRPMMFRMDPVDRENRSNIRAGAILLVIQSRERCGLVEEFYIKNFGNSNDLYVLVSLTFIYLKLRGKLMNLYERKIKKKLGLERERENIKINIFKTF